MAKVVYIVYNSIVTALLLAIISFKSVWLEMRVNIGLLIPIYAAIVCIVLCIIHRNRNHLNRKHKLVTIVNLLISGAVSVLILGISSIKVVPAAIIREGLHLVHAKFLYVNLALCAFLTAGLIIILVQKEKL